MDPAILNDEIDLLAALPFFVDFERDALKLIAFSADTRIVRAGDILFRRGDPADSGFLMLSGTVVLDDADNGDPAGSSFGRGALLGQYALLAPTKRPATAVMLDPGAVLKITRLLMIRVLDTYPDTARRLHEKIASDLSDTLSDVQRSMNSLMG